jgi:hypothetical protein
VVYPATSSDSASAKSKGDLFVSNKKTIIIKGNIGASIIIVKKYILWLELAALNEKDSLIETIISKINPSIISKFRTMQQLLIAAKTAYLFLLKIPVKITQKEKNIDIIDKYTILYSSSTKLKLGPHNEPIQNVYEIKRAQAGTQINNFLFVKSGIVIPFNNNFKASAINCKRPL